VHFINEAKVSTLRIHESYFNEQTIFHVSKNRKEFPKTVGREKSERERERERERQT
jgi:hypothetical protein